MVFDWPSASWKVALPATSEVKSNFWAAPLGCVTFLITIVPQVSIAPLAKSFNTALDDCEVRVLEMKDEKHGSDSPGKSALRLSPPSKKYGDFRFGPQGA